MRQREKTNDSTDYNTGSSTHTSARRVTRTSSRLGGAKKTHQQANMPSLVGMGDVVLADHESWYPMRKRTPPTVIHTPDAKGEGKNLSPIIGSPDNEDADDNTSNKKHQSTYANDLDYSNEDNDFLLNDEELNDDALMIEYMDTKRRSKSTHCGRGNLI